MKWKCLLLALALACGISAGGEAYDMNAVAAASLPKGFTYREAAGTETLHFMEKDIPYQMGQLQYTLEKQQSFSSGTGTFRCTRMHGSSRCVLASMRG